MRDPALLVWLDAPANRKGHPNENLARELMELFTLGIGHYSEGDVKEAARALTGWTVADGAFLEFAANHDPGEKTILGQSGKWAGSDLIRLLLEHPATARRLAGRLCETFMGEGSVHPQGVDELAEGLRSASPRYRLGRSRRSCGREPSSRRRTSARGSSGPVEFVVGAVRALELLRPGAEHAAPGRHGRADRARTCSTRRTSAAGPGGRTWLSSRGMIARVNFATALASGRELGLAGRPTCSAWPSGHGRDEGLDRVVVSIAEHLLGADPGAAWRDRIARSAATGSPSLAESARRAAALILSSPEAQLA